MEPLTIHAASPETGRAMLAALSTFRAELIETAEGCYVVVTLDRDDREIVAVLETLEEYVTLRRDGPARLDLSGKIYTLHPLPDN